MNLEIRSIAGRGDIATERVVLKALSDADVGFYAVLRSGVTASGQPTSGRKRVYWFPDADVKNGDTVVVYTKKGDSSKKTLDSGGTAHFFYWGSETLLWDDSHIAVLLYIPEWMALNYARGATSG